MKLSKALSLFACLAAMSNPAIADDDDDDDDDQGQDQGAAEIVVRCDRGGSINDALALADGSTRLTIVVRGTCVERVSINTDNVTIRGDNVFGGRIEGRFFVDARRVVIENLTISGDDRGIRAFNSGFVTVRDVTIERMTRSGIFALNGAVVVAERVTVLGPVEFGINANNGGVLDIRDSVVDGAETGVLGDDGSSVNIERSRILNSSSDGLSILHGSAGRVVELIVESDSDVAISASEAGSIRMRNSTVTATGVDTPLLFLDGGTFRFDGGNSFVGTNPFDSFTVRNGSYLRQRSNFGNPPDLLVGGMVVENQSFVTLSDSELTGDARIRRHAELEVRALVPGGVQIEGSINVSEDALLVFRGSGGVVTGDVICADEESSLSIATADAVFEGAVLCSAFD